MNWHKFTTQLAACGMTSLLVVLSTQHQFFTHTVCSRYRSNPRFQKCEILEEEAEVTYDLLV